MPRDEHSQQAAVLLAQAEDESDFDLRVLDMLEALVHAVLHLAEVIDVRETIARGG
jgi:hypothetical protein